MKNNIITKSKSGKTHIILNNDSTISFNTTPICTLAQLKWLKQQPNFKAGFLDRIPETYFEGVEAERIDITSLPILATAVQLNFAGEINDVRTWYGANYEGCFCTFKGDGNIAFVANTMINQDWEFLRNGETVEIFEERRNSERVQAKLRYEAWLKEMYAEARGWYVVTLDVAVSKIRGNDGNKTYSFRVLASNQMEAYERTCDMIMNEGLKDRNVSFVYGIADSAKSALIEYVGMWTDDAEH